MSNKIFKFILLANIFLFMWQSLLSISISTQGDKLSTLTREANLLQSQIDVLDNKIAQNSSLETLAAKASALGYIPTTIIQLADIKLADASR